MLHDYDTVFWPCLKQAAKLYKIKGQILVE